jgi:galactonate dehydratase
MKITGFQTYHVRPRWLCLKIETDVGIAGWGEPTLEGRAQTVETAVREMMRELIGEDPRRIEHHWQTLYRGSFYRGGPVLTSALSGIEQALWDILGRHLRVPVHQLLGGRVRDRIRMYGWSGGEPTGDYVENVQRSVAAREFSAYKLVPVPAMQAIETPAVVDRVVALVAGVREKIGRHVDLALDFHGRVSPAMAPRLAQALEPFQPFFLEEPVLPGDTAALRDLSGRTTIPIAAGERLFTRWQFQELIEQRAVAVVQPDLSHCGGIAEARKIAAMAESRNIAIAPHCPLGPIALAASLQLAACTPNFLIQEHLTLGEGLLREPFRVVDGLWAVPDGPGLGIEIDEEKLRGRIFAGDWRAPQFRLPDGSFAEW